ncbi:MAG: hypothetical protein LIP16_21910 [Clostridium sp.]|nr:hypothetical protein [Clostridium sp.]
MRGGSGRFKGRYDFFTIYFIPGTTVLLASRDSWTDTNLSVLGNAAGHKFLFALWGFTVGIYYCAYILYLFNIGRYRNKAVKTIIYTAAGFLLTAVMLPYMPEKYPFKSQLHVMLAFFSPILLVSGIVGFLRFLSNKDRPRFRRAWGIMWLLAAGACLFFVRAGFITSLLELFTVIGLCAYLRYMERLLVRY